MSASHEHVPVGDVSTYKLDHDAFASWKGSTSRQTLSDISKIYLIMTSSHHEKIPVGDMSLQSSIATEGQSNVRPWIVVIDYWDSTRLANPFLDLIHYDQILKQLLAIQLSVGIAKMNHGLIQRQSDRCVPLRCGVIQLLNVQNWVLHQSLHPLELDQWCQNILHVSLSAIVGKSGLRHSHVWQLSR